MGGTGWGGAGRERSPDWSGPELGRGGAWIGRGRKGAVPELGGAGKEDSD